MYSHCYWVSLLSPTCGFIYIFALYLFQMFVRVTDPAIVAIVMFASVNSDLVYCITVRIHSATFLRQHLEEGVGLTGKILKFADDTKLFRNVREIGDKQNLQDDIDKLVKWSEKWQMLFNFGKRKCLHTGSGNTGMNYEMGGTILSKTVKEKDLGVTMNANMKVSEQCRILASKGNQVLGMIRRNIT